MEIGGSVKDRSKSMREARKVFLLTMFFNLLVAIGKIVWGLFSNTLSMLADGLHSALDATSNVIGIAALSISLKPPDEGHPYGHRKFEAVAAIIISFFMFLACFEVVTEAVERFRSDGSSMPRVTLVSYLIMVVTMCINFLVSRYEHKKGEELKIDLLVADSKHTMSDVYVSLTVIFTLVAIQLNFPVLDTIASFVIVAVILKAGFDIIMAHLGTLVDAVILDPDYVRKLVLEIEGVTGCHRIRSRGAHDHIFLDLHVQVPRHLSIEQAHALSYQVEEKLKKAAGGVVDVLVHMEDDAPGPDTHF